MHIMLSRLTVVVASVGLATVVCQSSISPLSPDQVSSSAPSLATTVCQPSISPLSPDQVSSYAPFTHFAGAVFCDLSQIVSWSCGGDLCFRAPVVECPRILVIF